MACQSAFTAGRAGLLGIKFMSVAGSVRRLAALGSDLALLFFIHSREAAFTFNGVIVVVVVVWHNIFFFVMLSCNVLNEH